MGVSCPPKLRLKACKETTEMVKNMPGSEYSFFFTGFVLL